MGVEVDEAGRDHEPGRIDHPLGAAERGADGGDLAVHDRHIANCVHSARGIHNTAARDHQTAHIVALLRAEAASRQIPAATTTSIEADASCL